MGVLCQQLSRSLVMVQALTDHGERWRWPAYGTLQLRSRSEKSAKFYESFWSAAHGREDYRLLAMYLSDGVVNLALIKFSGTQGNDLAIPQSCWLKPF
jgi:hypothetical protein